MIKVQYNVGPETKVYLLTLERNRKSQKDSVFEFNYDYRDV